MISEEGLSWKHEDVDGFIEKRIFDLTLIILNWNNFNKEDQDLLQSTVNHELEWLKTSIHVERDIMANSAAIRQIRGK